MRNADILHKCFHVPIDIFALLCYTLSSAPFAPSIRKPRNALLVSALLVSALLVSALLVSALLVSALLVSADKKHYRCSDDAVEKFAQEPGMSANSTRRFAFLNRYGPPTLIMLESLWLLQSVFAHTGSHGVIIHNLNCDAGTVKVGSVVTDNVRLINLSSQPVEVDAQPGCGCTVVDVPEKPLAPLHSEVVKLKVDTDGMGKGQQAKGVLLAMQAGAKSWEQVASIKFQIR